MTIKCPRSTMILLCVNYLVLGATIVLGLQFGHNVLSKGETTLLSLICSVFFLYPAITSAIFFGKTIELHEDGCTVHFLFFRKCFSWSHYETKLYQRASGKKTAAISIHATILFLPRFLRKTKSPLFFCQFFYPFSGICLAVQPDKATKIFEINEKDIYFFQQLGIQIRGLPENEKNE